MVGRASVKSVANARAGEARRGFGANQREVMSFVTTLDHGRAPIERVAS